MTINEVLSRLRKVKASAYDINTMGSWLVELERRLLDDFFSSYEEPVDAVESFPEDGDKPLLLPDEYVSVYETYLAVKIDYYDRNWNAYNASLAMFNSEIEAFKAWWNRTHQWAKSTGFRNLFG